jgi:hypothetical protein
MTNATHANSVKAKTTAFGNFVDIDRSLVDLPNLSLVEVDLPEYERNGLGRALLKVIRYNFEDIGQYGVEGMSIGADSSRGQMVYADMNPVLVGLTHSQVQEEAPTELIKMLYERQLPLELVTLAVLRRTQFDGIESLVKFVEMYHQRASWLERHPVEVRFANIEAMTGHPVAFDWERIQGAE